MSDSRAKTNDDKSLFLSKDKLALLNKMLEKRIIDPIEILNSGHRHAKTWSQYTKEGFFYGLKWVEDNEQYRLETPMGVVFGLDYVHPTEASKAFPDEVRAFLSETYNSGSYTFINCDKAIPLDLLKELLYPAEKQKRELALLASTIGQLTRQLNRDLNPSGFIASLPTEVLHYIVMLTMAPFSILNYENALVITKEKFEKPIVPASMPVVQENDLSKLAYAQLPLEFRQFFSTASVIIRHSLPNHPDTETYWNIDLTENEKRDYVCAYLENTKEKAATPSNQGIFKVATPAVPADKENDLSKQVYAKLPVGFRQFVSAETSQIRHSMLSCPDTETYWNTILTEKGKSDFVKECSNQHNKTLTM